jgi:hypothetical protein
MSEIDLRTAKLPLLFTVDGESKTAKTTAGEAMTAALLGRGLKVFEAEAGAFLRRLTICTLELLGYTDFDTDVPEILGDRLHEALVKVIKNDTAYETRDWPNLHSRLVERYVSVISNITEAQDAKDTWYEKIIKQATGSNYDVMVINARNPRERLREWGTPVFDLLVFCEPREAARRILKARGVEDPDDNQLNNQTADVEKRRHLDRHRDKYEYEDPKYIITYTDNTTASAANVIEQSFNNDSVDNQPDAKPATVRLDTTHINLEQTRAIISALALAAYDRQLALAPVVN